MEEDKYVKKMAKKSRLYTFSLDFSHVYIFFSTSLIIFTHMVVSVCSVAKLMALLDSPPKAFIMRIL
jgi:hypothetical protein